MKFAAKCDYEPTKNSIKCSHCEETAFKKPSQTIFFIWRVLSSQVHLIRSKWFNTLNKM